MAASVQFRCIGCNQTYPHMHGTGARPSVLGVNSNTALAPVPGSSSPGTKGVYREQWGAMMASYESQVRLAQKSKSTSVTPSRPHGGGLKAMHPSTTPWAPIDQPLKQKRSAGDARASTHDHAHTHGHGHGHGHAPNAALTPSVNVHLPQTPMMGPQSTMQRPSEGTSTFHA